jgi:hypothetical protein
VDSTLVVKKGIYMSTRPGTIGMSLTLMAVALLMASSSALAGGFQLSIETPSPSSDQTKDAVLVARTYGCHQPADSNISASAEGLVGGKRQSIPLDLRSIGSGVYAIKQQWPSEGTWFLTITGPYNSISVLVELGPNGQVIPGTRLEEDSLKGVHAKAVRRQWIASDIDTALRNAAGLTSDTSGDSNGGLSLGPTTWLLAGLGASVFTVGLVALARRRHASSESPKLTTVS